MKKLVFYLVFTVGTLYASHTFAEETGDELMERAQSQFEPIPAELPATEGIELTPERVELGKWLFFDPRLSGSWLISCNTCHNLALGGVDFQETSIGHGWAKGPRNAPTVLNAVFNIAQFWDGRADDLHAQAQGPIQASVEMNNTPERVEKTLKSIPEYVKLFKKAFPEEARPVSFDTMAEAIEAFEATLLTPGSSFDQFLKGDAQALTGEEKKGLKLFMDKGCSTCHNGINVGGAGYRPFGVMKKPDSEILPREDTGRFKVTKSSGDKYVFKIPTLRNIALTPPYFHSGKVWDLERAVDIMGSVQLGINLSDDETAAIVAFLKTLTGHQPRMAYPILPAHTEETPLPITTEAGSDSANGH